MNLESLKSAAQDARAEAQRTALAFKKCPDTKTLAAKEIAAQLAANADEAVEFEEKRIESEAHADLVRKRDAAAVRADRVRVLAEMEPEVKELAGIITQLEPIVRRITEKVADQNDAVFELSNYMNVLGEPHTARTLDRFDVRAAVVDRLRSQVKVEAADLADWIRVA